MLEKIALQKKLISEQDCQKAIEACKSSENVENALKDYFITHNLIQPKTLEQLIDMIGAVKIIKKNIRFGAIAIEMGFINQETLDATLKRQRQVVADKKQPKLIGELLLELGQLTKEQLQLILLEQDKANFIVEPIDRQMPVYKGPGHTEDIQIPQSSEKIQFGLILDIEDNGLSAFLRKTDDFYEDITVDDIHTILLAKNIQYGIENSQAVEGFIHSSGFKTDRFKIAAGRPKDIGKKARIEYYFDTDHLNAGQLDEGGSIDFKERGKTPRVEANTLLAEKFIGIESKNGRNIFGTELIADPVPDIQLKIKSGVFLSDDGMRVYSQISGYPKLSWSGNISVIETFTVEGDMGFETGHIDYDGPIEVQGGLKNGFKIAGTNITVGSVDGGEIHAQGNVSVINGINDGTIYARGHLNVKYIHNSKIFCLGNVTVEKEIVDSQIESSGACLINNGSIVNSSVAFNQGIHAKHIGTEKTKHNIIVIGQDLFVRTELKAIEAKIEAIEKERSKIEGKRGKIIIENEDYYKAASKITNELDIILEERQAIETEIISLTKYPEQKGKVDQLETELNQKKIHFSKLDKELNDQFNFIKINENKIKRMDAVYDELGTQLDDLNQEKINFTDWQNANTGKPIMTAAGRVFSGTAIKTPHAQKEIKETVANVKIEEMTVNTDNSSNTIYEIQINDTLNRK